MGAESNSPPSPTHGNTSKAAGSPAVATTVVHVQAQPAIALYPQPIMGVPMRPPAYQPQPGQVIIGYQMQRAEVGVTSSPHLLKSHLHQRIN
jgi:hypothetical protein